MRPLTLGDVVSATRGELLRGDLGRAIARVCTDTRDPLLPDALFVPLSGPNFDGHDHLGAAATLGAGAALVARSHGVADVPAGIAHVVVVDDTLDALQAIASAWRDRFVGEVVGVTGSNGKTVVKDMLAAILAREHTAWRSPGSFNSQVGVALSLLGLRPEHDVAVIEAGISKPGEMARLERMVRPTLGVLTHIGHAHAAHLHTLETTYAEKLNLFRSIPDHVIYPGAGEVFEVTGLSDQATPFWVLDEDDGRAGVVLHDVESDARGGWSFALRLQDGESLDARIDAPARHDLSNAAAAAAAARALGSSTSSIRDGLASYAPRASRLELHTTPGGVTLINDSYSADPTSAVAALETLRRQAPNARRVAILGDMLDLGALAPGAHRELGTQAARAGVSLLITTGEHRDVVAGAALEAGVARALSVEDEDELHALLGRELRDGDVVLLKASGAVGLDRAATRLLESLGPARLEIDLDAVRHNYHALRRHLGRGTRVMAVVKSYGYGNDATRVSRALVREGVDALAVAYADEGVALRRAGLTLPILVTNALAHESDKLVRHDLTPLLSSFHFARALAREATARGIVSRVHVEVDTGMRRAGFTLEQLGELLSWLEVTPSVQVGGVMTHFAGADEARHDDYTGAQLSTFHAALERFRGAGVDPGVVHAANTSAAWRLPEAAFDMVRLGLGLYGVQPSDDVARHASDTRPALKFSTKVVDVRPISKGKSVGYGLTWRAPRDGVLATIAAGYNDGFPRFMSNGGEVLIGGRRCPVVGNVCMDVAVVDVTDLTPLPSPGDEVVLFGGQGDETLTVDAIAARGGTISYEILCNVSPRVRRIFLRGT